MLSTHNLLCRKFASVCRKVKNFCPQLLQHAESAISHRLYNYTIPLYNSQLIRRCDNDDDDNDVTDSE